jgi:DNA repair exonuclease SbcCD nuclease subunit
MKKSVKIAHLSDLHIHNLKFHKEYLIVFEELYATLRKEKPDFIVLCGDIAHSKTNISPEFVEICGNFFKNLANIAETFVILGNHDCPLKNTDRQDAISPIVSALGIPNLHLLKKSCEVPIQGTDIVLNALSIVDEAGWTLTPTDPTKINLALYHGAIKGSRTDAGWMMDHGDHDISIFNNFDYVMLGDLHLANQQIQKMEILEKIIPDEELQSYLADGWEVVGDE